MVLRCFHFDFATNYKTLQIIEGIFFKNVTMQYFCYLTCFLHSSFHHHQQRKDVLVQVHWWTNQDFYRDH